MTRPQAVARTSPRPTPAKPLWRLSYDLVENQVGPLLTNTIHSETFADVLATAARVRRLQYRMIERTTRRILHAWNMPAATDIRRLETQIAALQRQIAGLPARLESERRATPPPARRD